MGLSKRINLKRSSLNTVFLLGILVPWTSDLVSAQTEVPKVPQEELCNATTGYNIPDDFIQKTGQIPQDVLDLLNTPEYKIADPIVKILVGYYPGLPFSKRVDGNILPIFPIFTQAYHTLGIPAVKFWRETVTFYNSLRPPLLYIEETLQIMDQFWIFQQTGTLDYCFLLQKHAITVNSWSPTNKLKPGECKLCIRHMVNYCLNREPMVKQHIRHEDNLEPLSILDRLMKACYLSLSVTMEAFVKALFPMNYNGKPGKWDYSPFNLMYLEAKEYGLGVKKRIETTFPAYIAKVRAEGHEEEANHLDETLKEIKRRLTDPSTPYTFLYLNNGDFKTLHAYWDVYTEKFRNDIWDLYTKKTISSHGLSFKEHLRQWKVDLQKFKGHLGDGTVVKFKDMLLSVYSRASVNVNTSKPEYVNGTLVGDGMWDWIPTDVIQNMRLSWDLMGAVLEELKCYMKETYYFDLREKAIMDTQVDLKKSVLYSDLSQTMFQPCRISPNNETDLVTQYCTAENHEICAPLTPFHHQQRPENQYFGGLALLKPRWIYKYDKKTKKCVGRRDYVKLMHVCQCGFRLDCGDDLGENITCQLDNNDLLRGQCRGTVGYPCKSLPLAPGYHHQSCLSGYCNMRMNSCEDKPYIYRKYAGGGATALKWGKLTLGRYLVHNLALAIVVIGNGWIFKIFYRL